MTKLSTGQWVRARRWTTVEGVARDQGDVILSWLTRIAVGIAVTAVIGFDSLSIAVTHVSARDDANSAARAASQAWSSGHGDLGAASAAAGAFAAQHGETLVPGSLRVDVDGTAHLQLTHEATTMVVRHLGPLRSWADVTASGSGRGVS